MLLSLLSNKERECCSKIYNSKKMIQLQDKVAIVTGATRGIGRAIALTMAKAGAKVAFTYASSEQAAQDLEKEIQTLGVEVFSSKFDVADFDACQDFVNEVVTKFGGIDVLINNAGITKDGLLMKMSKADWDRVIKVNLDSVFNFSKATLRPFIKRKGGSIINMTSVVGVQGNAGQINYAASKAGVIGVTKSMAKEYGKKNIRVNAVAPGFIRTEMTAKLDQKVLQEWESGIPLNRVGETQDVANLCLYLSSDMASYISGQVVNVCGGMLT